MLKKAILMAGVMALMVILTVPTARADHRHRGYAPHRHPAARAYRPYVPHYHGYRYQAYRYPAPAYRCAPRYGYYAPYGYRSSVGVYSPGFSFRIGF